MPKSSQNPSGRIETVFFDWGGVLIHNPADELAEYCSQALDCPMDMFISAYHLEEYPFYTGSITEQEFWGRMCSRLGRPLPDRESLWADAFASAYRPIDEMFEIASTLKAAGIKVGLLSNTEPPCLAFTKAPRFECFEIFVFSFEIGIAKPDPKIYHAAIELAQTAPHNILFIDDKAENTIAARDTGMKAITFKTVPQFKNDLKQITGIGAS